MRDSGVWISIRRLVLREPEPIGIDGEDLGLGVAEHCGWKLEIQMLPQGGFPE